MKQSASIRRICCLAVLGLLLVAASAAAQTIAPPIAEYRGKAQGSFELRNDGDVPLAVTVEVYGFQVSPEGEMKYVPLDPAIQVEFGNSSFTIPGHQSHLIFYKAKTKQPNVWFAIMSTMTRAVPVRNQLRINMVLPHIVYAYQKPKLKQEDVSATLNRSDDGSFRLAIVNRSDKLSRVERIECKGFEKNDDQGGLPVFPLSTRYVKLAPGTPTAEARVRVIFEDGFTIEAKP